MCFLLAVFVCAVLRVYVKIGLELHLERIIEIGFVVLQLIGQLLGDIFDHQIIGHRADQRLVHDHVVLNARGRPYCDRTYWACGDRADVVAPLPRTGTSVVTSAVRATIVVAPSRPLRLHTPERTPGDRTIS